MKRKKSGVFYYPETKYSADIWIKQKQKADRITKTRNADRASSHVQNESSKDFAIYIMQSFANQSTNNTVRKPRDWRKYTEM